MNIEFYRYQDKGELYHMSSLRKIKGNKVNQEKIANEKSS